MSMTSTTCVRAVESMSQLPKAIQQAIGLQSLPPLRGSLNMKVGQSSVEFGLLMRRASD